MARRKGRRHGRRHHTRGFGFFSKSVNSTDVVVGGLIGLVGGMAAKAGLKALVTDPANQAIIDQAAPVVTASLVGVGAYFLEKKSSRGLGHMVGAISVGVAVSGAAVVKQLAPASWNLGDTVALRVAEYRGLSYLVDDVSKKALGYLVDDRGRAAPQYRGFRGSSDASLGRLADLTVGDTGDDDFNDIQALARMHEQY